MKDKVNKASLNWYPGHMAKATRELEDNSKLVDMIIELRDARMPLASFNTDFEKIFKNKKRLIIFNKSDLIGDDNVTLLNNHFNSQDILFISSKSNNVKKIVVNKIKECLKDKIDRFNRKGIRNVELRVMIVGIPNVGKSTLINTLASKKSAKVENKPGVTRSLEWVNIDSNIKLLDTPGILLPKLNSNKDALLLSLLGSINDDIINYEECANFALWYLHKNYNGVINNRYGIDETSNDLLTEVSNIKKIYKKDNEIDIYKTSVLVVNDVRNNKFGNILWEKL